MYHLHRILLRVSHGEQLTHGRCWLDQLTQLTQLTTDIAAKTCCGFHQPCNGERVCYNCILLV
jgi:hypothetical protein